jgi:adenylate cyclase
MLTAPPYSTQVYSTPVYSTPVYSTLGIPLIPGMRRTATAETTCATVLFADLHGYDALVEKLPPPQVLSLLAEFFAVFTNAVLEWGGQTFHQTEADIMAGFGVGDSRHTQIYETIAAARTIQQSFASIRASWQRRYAIDAGVGIGIHRGEVAIGVFEFSERTLRTLVGDTANVAAQLCRRARAGEVLMSAAVYLPHEYLSAAIGPTERMPFLPLPQLQLRGRSAPLDVWCVPAPMRLRMRHAADGVLLRQPSAWA